MNIWKRIVTVLCAVLLLSLKANADPAQITIVESDSHITYMFLDIFTSSKGYKFVDASVEQYKDDPQKGNLIAATVLINVDFSEQTENPVSSWHLYINDIFELIIPVYTIMGCVNPARKDINYYASAAYNGTIESAYIVPVSVTGEEMTDDKIIICSELSNCSNIEML